MKRILLPVAAILTLWACATLEVTTDYDHSKDFSTVKTYAIYENPNNARSVSQLNEGRIVNSVKSTLNAKGYTESATPDMWVNVNTIVKNKQQVTANTNTDWYGYGGFYRPYGYWGGGPGFVSSNSQTSFDVENYKDGSVVIDMIDARDNKMFWEGVGNSEIDSQIDNPDQKIADAVNKILASFPAAGAQPKAK